MEQLRVVIAESNQIIGEGLKALLARSKSIEVLPIARDQSALLQRLTKYAPNALLINYCADGFSELSVDAAIRLLPSLTVIGITPYTDVPAIRRLLKSGLSGHILQDCDDVEIKDSVLTTQNGSKFFCGKVLDRLNEAEGTDSEHGCDPVLISDREIEILNLIAEGLTNKQVAEKLHISTHTVMTHRKNMMSKLGINNTAGLIMYAVKENLLSPNRFLFSSEN